MSAEFQMAFGIPTYNHAHQFERTLESILGQSFSSFGVIVVDDASSDDTANILARYQDEPRFRVVRNPKRLGYTRNAAKAYRLCREIFPDIEFFAWGSDHDLWHPHWLLLLLERLKDRPEASLAWSWFHTIDTDGKLVRSSAQELERGMSPDRHERMICASREAPAGSLIHGLMRVSALNKTSGLRRVLEPDRLLVAELAAIGPFVVVPEFLWCRRYFGLVSPERQRRNSFPEGAPLYTYLPPLLQHVAVLLRIFVFSRQARLAFSSGEGWSLVRTFLAARRGFDRQQKQQAQYTLKRHRQQKQREKKRRSWMRSVRLSLVSLTNIVANVAQSAIPLRLKSAVGRAYRTFRGSRR